MAFEIVRAVTNSTISRNSSGLEVFIDGWRSAEQHDFWKACPSRPRDASSPGFGAAIRAVHDCSVDACLNEEAIDPTPRTILENVTVAENRALSSLPGSTLIVEGPIETHNSLYVRNEGRGFLPILLGEFVQSSGYNLLDSDIQSSTLLSTDLIVSGSTGWLVSLQDNGGPTWTHALLFGSPAIDAADRSILPERHPPSDQRGVARPQDGGGAGGAAPDIGAYEASAAGINGIVFRDFNEDGVQGAEDPGLPGRKVFLDTNLNGLLDFGEPFTVTQDDDPTTTLVNEAGQFSFDPLAAGGLSSQFSG